MSGGALQFEDGAGTPLPANARWFASRVLSGSEAAAFADAARRRGTVLERDGLARYGLGTALRIAAPEGFGATGAGAVLDALRSIRAAGPSTERGVPFVIGSLPFDRSAPAYLEVPERAMALAEDGTAHLVVVGAVADLGELLEHPLDAGDLAAAAVSPIEPPDRFELVSAHSHGDFRALVAEAVDAIRAARFDKVVVAREVTVTANRPFAPLDLLGRLRALYPSCATFSFGTFVGASPELLCRRSGSVVSTHPLAGTVARSGDPEKDRRLAEGLLASEKDRTEHRIVVDAIVDDLAKLADRVDAADQPHLLELRNVVHLATSIEAELTKPAPGALEVALALHPTPAVGGWPRDAALEWLADHEPLERDRYAGPLGFMDQAGDGEFWLGLRSALLDGATARLLAGVGIVADSDPASELAETQLKLQALLAAAVRP